MKEVKETALIKKQANMWSEERGTRIVELVRKVKVKFTLEQAMKAQRGVGV